MTPDQVTAAFATLAKEVVAIKKAHNELTQKFEALARQMTGQPATHQDVQLAAFYSGGEDSND